MLFSNDQTMFLLKKGLDAAALRQRVIAHNLANLNTPNFKRSQVSFEETLRKAQGQTGITLTRTHERHLQPKTAPAGAKITTDYSTSNRLDGNNVDLEREMLEMVANQLRYNTYIQQVNSRFNNWRTVINEGRR